MTDNPVLGVNFGTHDAAAALVANGRVLAAAEEERFTRVKHTKQFPHQAARWCLNHAGVDPDDLAAIALFVDPRRQLLLPVVNTRYAFPTSLGSLVSDIDKYRKRRRLPGEIRRSGLAPDHVPIRPVAHHLAHAASAYLVSPFDDATVVTIDGRGEYETACVFEGRDGHLLRRHAITYPHSIGYLYSMVTRFLGFRPQRDEYKVMGLAAYGSAVMADQVGRLASLDPASGKLRLNLAYFDHHRSPSGKRCLFSPLLVELLGPPRSPSDDITARHRDIAYATQRLTERLVLGYLRFARRLVGSHNLCLAGGVALNAVANAAVIACGEFDQAFIQPAAGDAGTSIGAALVVERDSQRNYPRASQEHTFLGSDIDECDVRRCLDELPACYQVHQLTRPHERAAELLHEDKIIGWCRGPMEFGPRALGHRSILAAPSRSEAVHRLNADIKGREDFRPLAPAVLAEDAHEYFDVQPAGRDVYPYMLATAAVRDLHRHRIPAVVHVDGSARVQTVRRISNGDFWSLIACYRARSGLPIVLNTSLNHSDEPIVRTPSDAVRTFLRCQLDALVLADYVIERHSA
ncbi:MAG: carbamoyltransferase family protein [Pseudonocardiaceae bacterium]